jgi:predicted nucleotidyltransferase component of viral defense system
MQSKNPIGRIYSINEVKTDFVNYPYPFLFQPISDDGIILAHIDDVVALKLGAIANRGAKKDMYDLYFILQHYTIKKLVELYIKKFNVMDSFSLLKSLTYFGDADEQLPPQLLIETKLTWNEIKRFIERKVKEEMY